MNYSAWRISYQDSEQAAVAAYRMYQLANDENAKLHGWLRAKCEKAPNERALAKANADLRAEVLALRGQRRELLEMIYNAAVGQVAMGYSVDAEGLARSAYSITGLDAAEVLKEPEL
jgi:hypothetical protein